MLLCDFHIHSNFSDGQLSIPELIDFYGSKKFDVIAITDHLCDTKSVMGALAHTTRLSLNSKNFGQYLKTINEEAVRAWECYQMLVLPGIEITKNSMYYPRSSHILAIDCLEFISPEDPVEKVLEHIHKAGGLSVAAHPVPYRSLDYQTLHLWNRRKELSSLIDAWEVASGPHWSDVVAKSGLPMLASSDLHRPSQLKSWKTILHADKSKESVRSAIKNQLLDFVFYESSRHTYRQRLYRAPRTNLNFGLVPPQYE